MSKILERVINTRIVQYLSKEDLLPYEQFGFRSGHSTTQQVTRLTEYITEGFNMGMHTGAIFLDASAAFDTVWTTGLLYKMAKMGFTRHLIKLLQSYLTGRTFRVTVEGRRSDTRQVANGTPQGSILGPVLFIMYTSDIPRPIRIRKALFADDTSGYYRHKDPRVLTRYLQHALDALLQYFRRWRLKINAQKTEAVIFSRRKTTAFQDLQLRIEGTPLPWKSEAKFLGVILDKRLTLAAHIKNLKKKAMGAMAIIYPLINRRSKLSPALKVRLTTAYIRPILTYAAPAWTGLASDTKLIQLQRIQNKYLRIAMGKQPRTRTSDLHRDSSTPRLGDFVVKTTKDFYSKAANHDNPLIAGLGQYSPETTPYRMRHKMPKHRLFAIDT
jgi:hypothetical protein